MLDFIQSWLGASAAIVIAIFLLLLTFASEVWEWVVWLNLRREAAASQVRSGSELTSVVAGTISIALLALFLLCVSPELARGAEWAINFWILVGMGVCWLAVVVAPFCRAKLRVPGIASGLLMAGFWWEL